VKPLRDSISRTGNLYDGLLSEMQLRDEDHQLHHRGQGHRQDSGALAFIDSDVSRNHHDRPHSNS